MTLHNCYAQFGGDYEDAVFRLTGADLVELFALEFLDDPSYVRLCRALRAGGGQEAFRAAHTLKGVAQNLGFTRLYLAVCPLTEALRLGSVPEDAPILLARVTEEYDRVTKALRAFQRDR